jgi:hypothetical protein
VVIAGALLKPLIPHAWEHLGGLLLLAGVLVVLLAGVAHTAKAR